MIFKTRYRVFKFPDIMYYQITGNTRYRVIPDVGLYPISDPMKKCPDIGNNNTVTISGYTDIGTYVPISGHVKNPDAADCRSPSRCHWPALSDRRPSCGRLGVAGGLPLAACGRPNSGWQAGAAVRVTQARSRRDITLKIL
jgi:hypothetical protein